MLRLCSHLQAYIVCASILKSQSFDYDPINSVVKIFKNGKALSLQLYLCFDLSGFAILPSCYARDNDGDDEDVNATCD